jgi:hypothetical protein
LREAKANGGKMIEPELENIDLEVLAKAFDRIPNALSVFALNFFLTQKCLIDGHKKSCWTIYSAFLEHWAST